MTLGKKNLSLQFIATCFFDLEHDADLFEQYSAINLLLSSARYKTNSDFFDMIAGINQKLEENMQRGKSYRIHIEECDIAEASNSSNDIYIGSETQKGG